jgi:hypothetical protein
LNSFVSIFREDPANFSSVFHFKWFLYTKFYESTLFLEPLLWEFCFFIFLPLQKLLCDFVITITFFSRFDLLCKFVVVVIVSPYFFYLHTKRLWLFLECLVNIGCFGSSWTCKFCIRFIHVKKLRLWCENLFTTCCFISH